MEFRVLQYFLAIAREGTISDAAERLHITQPTLSRQIKELEDELGKQLFIRSNKKITLTKEGMLLRQRAKEIVDLVDKTTTEIMSSNSIINGEVYIGAGESHTLKVITKSIKKIQKQYPQIKFHLHSGNAPDIIEKLDNGLIDFGLITYHPKLSKYNHLALPLSHQWGILMPKNDPLSLKEYITLEDIKEKPLIISKETRQITELMEWFGNDLDHLDIVSSYSLLYNASLMVEDGLGYAICFDKLINTTGESKLCFRPLSPTLKVPYYFIWKKYHILTQASSYFLDTIKETVEELSNNVK